MQPTTPFHIPLYYRLVFLWLEPLSIFAGAVYAGFLQPTYLSLIHASSAPGPLLPVSTAIVMTQLANLYLGLTMLEAFVLRASHEIQVWRTFIIALLIADLGHLYSLAPLGSSIYWDYSRWNEMDWGNVPFVYFLAVTRVLMLLGVGFPTQRSSQRLKRT